MDSFTRIRFLFTKYLQRQSSPEELDELISLLQLPDAKEAITEEMQLLWEEARNNKMQQQVDWDTMYASIIASGERTDTIIKKAVSRLRWPYYLIGIIILLLTGLLAWCLLFRL